jgi:2-haloacid dehalogenase
MSGLSDFEALSFDCYGTLIDWEAGISAVLNPWAAEHGLDLNSEKLLDLFAEQEARAEEQAPSALYPEILATTMGWLGERLGIAASQSDLERLSSSVPDWPAFFDSQPALASLASRYRLIILSNVDRDSFAASRARLGIDFDAVVTAEEVGSYKPALRNFEVLIERAAEIGVGEGRLLHVAQSLFHDHIPAQRMGLPTCWIDRRAGRSGWGATPPPPVEVRPNWRFTSMAALAAACVADEEAG